MVRGSKKAKIIEGLTKAYWMEMETVMNYIANSSNLDGIRAEEIKKSLSMDIQAEIIHATSFASRIKQVGGLVPGSLKFKADQKTLQPQRIPRM